MSIVVSNVTKHYGNQKALNDVSFEIKPGEIAGFIGPNGAGKSTMMKIITGFIPLDSGKVMVNGMDAVEASLEVRKIVGYLPENNPLYPGMYVREYLQFIAGLYKLGRQSRERVDEMIERTGLVPEQKKKIGALSKGYRQRVGLAQALLHDPQVLILDEPTSGLDPNQILEIRNLISEAGKEKTVMLSTHIMQEVEAICNRIIILNKGEIVANDLSGNIHSQHTYNTQIITAEFAQPLQAALLQSIPGVIKAVSVKNNTWLIEGTGESDLREKLFRFAVENHLTILSLQQQSASLEDVFRELTK
jgi:ABC-2 type transport system ATP-binding protein